MNQKNLLILFIIASLCVGFYFYMEYRQSNASLQGTIAKLDDISGTLNLNDRIRITSQSLANEKVIKNLDTISTEENSDVLLVFKNGAQVRLLENSSVSVSRDADQVVLTLHQGEIQFEEFNQENQPLLVSKNNKRYTAREFEAEFTKKSEINRNRDEKNLTQNSIQATLNAHKQDFYRCYLKALQKTPGLTGQATMQFQIERSGKVLKPKLNLQMNLQNEENKELETCLVEVLARTQFKSFIGEPITATFPLRFE